MPDNDLARTAARQAGVFTRQQALAAGFSSDAVARRLRTGHWRAVARGTYVATLGGRSRDRDLWTALLAVGSGAVLSHETAARLWALDGVLDVGAVTLTVPHRRYVAAPSGVVLHRSRTLGGADVVRAANLPVTSPARTLVDLAEVLPAVALHRAVADAVRRDLVTADRLAQAVFKLVGRHGSPLLRQVLQALDPRLESVLEEELLALLRNAGLPEPTPQYELRTPAGDFVSRLDLAFPEHRLGVEALGHLWHSAADDWQRDLRRHNAVLAVGWTYLAFSARDLRERPDYVVAAVRRELQRSRKAGTR